jgi:hypothetical protein
MSEKRDPEKRNSEKKRPQKKGTRKKCTPRKRTPEKKEREKTDPRKKGPKKMNLGKNGPRKNGSQKKRTQKNGPEKKRTQKKRPPEKAKKRIQKRLARKKNSFSVVLEGIRFTSRLVRRKVSKSLAADRAEERKRNKYAALTQHYLFAPVAIETLGAWGSGAMEFLGELGRRMRIVTGDPRSSAFLRQRIGIAVQRGNAVCISECLMTGASDRGES